MSQPPYGPPSGEPQDPNGGQKPYPGQPYPGQAPYGYAPYPPVDPNAKSKLVAGLLGIFLGSLGIHRFYLGYVGIGILQIVVTIVTFGVGLHRGDRLPGCDQGLVHGRRAGASAAGLIPV